MNSLQRPPRYLITTFYFPSIRGCELYVCYYEDLKPVFYRHWYLGGTKAGAEKLPYFDALVLLGYVLSTKYRKGLIFKIDLTRVLKDPDKSIGVPVGVLA